MQGYSSHLERIYNSFLNNAILQLIDFWPGWQAWKSVHFIGHILIFSIMAIGTLFPPPHKAKEKSKPAAADKAIPGVGPKSE